MRGSGISRFRAAGTGAGLLLAGLAGLSCGSSVQVGLESPEALGRILAIRQAGEAKNTRAVPLIVDRLEDEDEAVRLYAILALEKITGRRMGYDYAKPPVERAVSVERWRDFVREGRHVSGTGPGDRGTVVRAKPGSEQESGVTDPNDGRS